jgi:hypothetical protein
LGNAVAQFNPEERESQPEMTTKTNYCPLIVESVESEHDGRLFRITDRPADKVDVYPHMIEAPELTPDAAMALAREIVRVVDPSALVPWRELFPKGRRIYYEGDDPQGFAEQIRTEFGFDPSTDPDWGIGDWYMPDGTRCPDPFGRTLMFLCPPGILDAVYGSGRWMLGS